MHAEFAVESATHIADISDRASLFESQFTEDSIRSVRKNLAPQFHPDFDGVHCVECGDDLPLERIKGGRIYCTSCQNEREILDRLNGRGRR